MIALVDYGAGNLTSVRKALAAVGADVYTPYTPGAVDRARGVIVPGVGHFNATRPLDDAWRAALRARIDAGVPLLGICVGLQWLFEGSDEEPSLPGLGVFPGRCTRLPEKRGQSPFSREGPSSEGNSILMADSARARQDTMATEASRKVPHVGWNSLSFPRPSRLFAGIAEGAQVYFTHSYAAPVVDDTVAICDYGVPFSAGVERGLVSAAQFHPEKSGEVGLQVLRNWLTVTADAA